MQNGYLGSKTRTLTFAYRVGNGIYINLTNRCTNDCTFCLRNNGETAYGSNSLWLEREPTVQEVIEAVEAIYFQECDSFVFCGFGEPTCRFDTIIEVAKLLKE
ncbi:MAG: radical SAM protein, partial [Clostridia bacterium]|nr:radical SAM protein [Clostridia bacterium]